MEFEAKIIFSLIAVVLALGPMKADFDKTHATNPLWPPHARFHVVWQVFAQTGVSLVALYLLWGVPSELHNWIAAILNFNWGLTFYINLACMRAYGGTLADVNGIKPFEFNIGGKVRKVDTNLFGGTILMGLNGIGAVMLYMTA
jgi:hypothetical protein